MAMSAVVIDEHTHVVAAIDISTGEVLVSVRLDAAPLSLAISPDSADVAIGSYVLMLTT